MKNQSRLASAVDEIMIKLHKADDWHYSDEYKQELLQDAVDACYRLSNIATDLGIEIMERLEDKP